MGWENMLDFFDPYGYCYEFALGWRSSGVEQLICNQPVGGSNPFASSGRNASQWVRWSSDTLHLANANESKTDIGEVPERPKGADCKSAGVGLRRFESSPPHSTLRRCSSGEACVSGRMRFQPNTASL